MMAPWSAGRSTAGGADVRRAIALAVMLTGCGAADGAPPARTAQPTITASSASRSPTRHATPAQPAVRFTVVASGDFLIHQPVWDRALALGGGRRYDFAPLFRAIRPIVRAA